MESQPGIRVAEEASNPHRKRPEQPLHLIRISGEQAGIAAQGPHPAGTHSDLDATQQAGFLVPLEAPRTMGRELADDFAQSEIGLAHSAIRRLSRLARASW